MDYTSLQRRIDEGRLGVHCKDVQEVFEFLVHTPNATAIYIGPNYRRLDYVWRELEQLLQTLPGSTPIKISFSERCIQFAGRRVYFIIDPMKAQGRISDYYIWEV